MGLTPRPAADSAVRIGQVFLGKYKVEAILGQGGMGVVAKCTHLQLNELVAIKMLRPDVLVDADAVERFMREAQAAVKLKSEYVARVSDVGTLETGVPYMVMEFLEGIDLGALIDEQGSMQVPLACQLILQTAEALSEAHSLSIVHRDIKPANLFVTWRPDRTALIKVLDFGISKAPMGTDMHLTQTQSLLGTPAYMSPEQMRSAKLVDTRTDIWSLGSVMYELIEGRKPFEAESFSEMCVKVAVDAPQPMRIAPPELQQVILRCLAKSPEQRYPTMADLARDLVPFCQDPQQASVLVERMQRMLRRSDDSWETHTGTGNRSVPNYVRDPKSQPLHAQQWHPGSDPAGHRFSTPLPVPGAVPMHAAQERSAPALAQSEWRPTSRRSSKKTALWVIGLLAIGGIGAALAVTLTATEEPAQGSARVVEPTTPDRGDTAPAPGGAGQPVQPASAGDAAAKAAHDTSGSAAVNPPPAAGSATDPGLAKVDDKTPGKVDDKLDEKLDDKTIAKTTDKTARTTRPAVTRTNTKTVGKTTNKTAKDAPPKDTPPKDTTKEPACDPFANPRGCGNGSK